MTTYSASVPSLAGFPTVTKIAATTIPGPVTTSSGTTGVPPTVGQRWPAGVPTATNR